jgi:hypothetical protein
MAINAVDSLRLVKACQIDGVVLLGAVEVFRLRLRMAGGAERVGAFKMSRKHHARQAEPQGQEQDKSRYVVARLAKAIGQAGFRASAALGHDDIHTMTSGLSCWPWYRKEPIGGDENSMRIRAWLDWPPTSPEDDLGFLAAGQRMRQMRTAG